MKRIFRVSTAVCGSRLAGIAAVCLLIGCSTLTTENDPATRAFEARKKAIAAALKQVPPPAVPPEAQRHFDQAGLILKNSTDAVARQKAIAEFEACLSIAPWKADAYFNVARLKELASDFDGAIQNYQLYLLASPGTDDVRTVQNTISELDRKRPKTGAAALEGIWREVYGQRESTPRHSRDEFTHQYHYIAKVARNRLVFTKVFDKDDLAINRLAGEKEPFFWFTVEGRRLKGGSLYAPEAGAITGFASQDGTELQIKYKSGVDSYGQPTWFVLELRRFDE